MNADTDAGATCGEWQCDGCDYESHELCECDDFDSSSDEGPPQAYFEVDSSSDEESRQAEPERHSARTSPGPSGNMLGWGEIPQPCGWDTKKAHEQASERQGGRAPGGSGWGKQPASGWGGGAGGGSGGSGGSDPPRPPAPPAPPTGPLANLSELDDEEKWQWALDLRRFLWRFDPVMFIKFLCIGKAGSRSWRQSRADNERGPIPWQVSQKVTDHVKAAWAVPLAGPSSNRYASTKSSAPCAQHLDRGARRFGGSFVRSQLWLALLHGAHCTVNDQADWSLETRPDDYYGLGPPPRRQRPSPGTGPRRTERDGDQSRPHRRSGSADDHLLLDLDEAARDDDAAAWDHHRSQRRRHD